MSTPEDLTEWQEGTDGFEVLLEAARPDLYRTNAFRVAGLSVDATARDISRQVEKLKLMEKLGGGTSQVAGLLALDPAPDADAIREAMQRLRDPERRLVDEFFWFWPHQLGQSQTDEALTALGRGDAKAAADIWVKQESAQSDSNISMHNLAVLQHTTALDLEHIASSRPLSGEQKKERDQYWQKAFKRWKTLLEHEGFWSRLTARIRELDDPRLTTGTVRRVRASLPLALLSINAELAVRAAECGDTAEAQQHVRIMRASGFASDVADGALHRAVAPVRERIKVLCKTAEQEADADPVHADQVTRRLIEQTRPLLAVLDCVLPQGNPTRDGAHDEVALRVLACQIPFGNKTENWKVSLELVELALPIAASESARQRIRENIEIVRKNAESGNDWCGEGYFDLPEPVLSVLERARKQADARQWDQAIPILAELLMGRDEAQVEESAKPLVRKPLAYCLNLRAVDRLNRAMDRHNEPLPTMRRIAERAQLGFLTAAALLGSTYGVSSLKCMACGTSIYGQYARFTFKDIPIIVCVSCSSKLDREQEERKAELRETVRAAGQELLLAEELDSKNKGIKENLGTTRKVASELGVSFPDPLVLRIRLGLATVPDLVEGMNSRESDVRRAAAAALKKIDPALAHQLAVKRRIRRLRRFALAASILIAVWLGGNYISYLQGAPSATSRLYSYGLINQDEAIRVLTEEVSSGDYSDTLDAVKALEEIDPSWTDSEAATGAVPVLVAALKDESQDVREGAAVALEKIGQEAVPALGAALKDESWRVRQAAAMALGQISPDAIIASLFIESDFVRIAAGKFMMGSTNGESDEQPVHRVRISRDFEMGKHEVTQAQWEAVMGNNPSNFKGPDLPVETVSWDDVQEFINKLNQSDNKYQYRLPAEAEWEYAARAGSTGDYAGDLDAMAWYYDNSDSKTHPVGQKQANAWGLYDMHGNVWEWVQDWYDSDYYAQSPGADPRGPSSGSFRVLRGGGWGDDARYCRSAFRGSFSPDSRFVFLGLRLVRTAK
jgi:formylglycine-generating enzyme required for sulfatase activity